MGNSPTHSINYKPRYTQQEVYDLLPPTLKRAMQECITEFDTSALLRYYNKKGLKAALKWVQEGEL